MAVKEDLSRRFFEILDDFGYELSKDLVQELLDKGVSGSGGTASELAGSIRFRVTRKPSIIFTMNDYWEYVENGRRPGKKPPIDNLIEWINWKGGSSAFKKISNGLKLKTQDRSGKPIAEEKKVKTLAFIIAQGIAKRGTIYRFQHKGSNFVRDVLKNMRVEKLQEDIAREIGLEIEVILNDKLKGK